VSNRVILTLSDYTLSDLQESLGTRGATTPMKEIEKQAIFIRSSKALPAVPGYNEVEISISNLTSESILSRLGLIRDDSDDIDWEIVARHLDKAISVINSCNQDIPGATTCIRLGQAINNVMSMTPISEE
jgi:hypothetical protein